LVVLFTIPPSLCFFFIKLNMLRVYLS
jgi:hypothetical protein